MDNRIGELQVFLRVAEAGSFSAAARALMMTPSTVSKLVARMEARLGVRLFDRSTRSLSLTDEGRALQEGGGAVLDRLDAVEQDVRAGSGATEGTIRVTASVALGTLGLEPLLPALWEQHPRLVVDLSLTDEVVDLYLDRTDVAFRVGRLSDSGMIARRLGAVRRLIVAAPAYLAVRGAPASVADLDRHNCLGFNFRRAAAVWPVREDGRIVDRTVTGTLRANNGETVRRLAVAGAGLARLAEYHVRADLAAGRLVEVLADAGDEEEVHALHLGGANVPRRITAFLDALVPPLRSFLHG